MKSGSHDDSASLHCGRRRRDLSVSTGTKAPFRQYTENRMENHFCGKDDAMKIIAKSPLPARETNDDFRALAFQNDVCTVKRGMDFARCQQSGDGPRVVE